MNEAGLESRLSDILRADPLVRDALERARSLDLPQWWLTSGAIYQTVWNALSDRQPGYGIKDFDLIYFDGSDLSYAAENTVIERVASAFAGFAIPVETRNQARVHLWFEDRFGAPYPQLREAVESLRFYAAKTHAVAVRLHADDRLQIEAPFGLENIFAMRLVPNPAIDNGATYAEKAARMKRLWPALTLVE